MTGFSDKEIKAELARRTLESKEREAQTLGVPSKGGIICLRCHNPMHSWQATDLETPLCDLCLGE